MKSFQNLRKETLSRLQPLIEFWSCHKLDLQLSIDTKLDVNTTGITTISEYAICYAVLLDDLEMVKDLCANQVNLEVKDGWHKNQTPLEIAVEYGRADIAKTLLRAGAKPTENMETPPHTLCNAPLTFFWSIKELQGGRQADYDKVDYILATQNKL